MGSGSTGVAATNTGRHFIGIEVKKHHFDNAVYRITEAERLNSSNLFDIVTMNGGIDNTPRQGYDFRRIF
jgi:DNA modification methylase